MLVPIDADTDGRIEWSYDEQKIVLYHFLHRINTTGIAEDQPDNMQHLHREKHEERVTNICIDRNTEHVDTRIDVF